MGALAVVVGTGAETGTGAGAETRAGAGAAAETVGVSTATGVAFRRMTLAAVVSPASFAAPATRASSFLAPFLAPPIALRSASALALVGASRASRSANPPATAFVRASGCRRAANPFAGT